MWHATDAVAVMCKQAMVPTASSTGPSAVPTATAFRVYVRSQRVRSHLVSSWRQASKLKEENLNLRRENRQLREETSQLREETSQLREEFEKHRNALLPAAAHVEHMEGSGTGGPPAALDAGTNGFACNGQEERAAQLSRGVE